MRYQITIMREDDEFEGLKEVADLIAPVIAKHLGVEVGIDCQEFANSIELIWEKD